MRSLRRARRLLGPAFLPETVPDVVHVLAAAGTVGTAVTSVAPGLEMVGSAVARPWGTLPDDSIGAEKNIHALRTLRTADVPAALPDVDASDDLFLLCLFRAISTHVLTSGANLRSEPNLEMSLFPKLFRDDAEKNEDEKERDHTSGGLLALRSTLGLPGAVPVPIVLTRSGADLDFSSPFFNPPVLFPEPILIVSTDSAQRDIKRRLAEVPAARAQVYSAGSMTGGRNGSAGILTPMLALDFAREVLGAQRISVECGPSITAQLHAVRAIKAVSLSILVATPTDRSKPRRIAPVLGSDALFDGLDGLIKGRYPTGGCDREDTSGLHLELKSSTTSLSAGSLNSGFGWVYEFWAQQ